MCRAPAKPFEIHTTVLVKDNSFVLQKLTLQQVSYRFRRLISAFALMTRCQGTSDPTGNACNARPTFRASRGIPASAAI